VRSRFVLAGFAALALATGAVSASAAPGVKRASGTAIAVIVKVPGQDDVSAGYVSAPPNGTGGANGYTFGEAVQITTATTRVQTGPGAAPRATADSELHGVSLLGGAVDAARVMAQARALASADNASGDFAGSVVEGLKVLGDSAVAVENGRIELGGIGYLVTLEGAVLREDAEGLGYRGFFSALHLYLTSEHSGLPAGSEIIVGYADAGVRGEASQEAAPAPEPGGQENAGSGSDTEPAQEPEPPPPGSHSGPPAIVRDPPASVQPDITGGGFVYPVYGTASFSDDFAAPRADTIWHHGNDIFAPQGAPVLAVTDGTLFLVGWNRLGGHRLWLRDDQGNEYYYAHLSAYSSLSVNGARVSAGDVLGFVGASGVAGGVSHLHFEIHPSALLGLGYDGVINPYTYLLAWQAQQDRDFSITIPVEEAPQPGVVLLEGNDISAVSGLDADAVARAFESPLLLGVEEAGLLTPAPPGLVGAPPGF
jgi:hypothetical protein